MPIQTIEFKEGVYPHFQSEGNAAAYVIPFAQKVCKGVGFDIGCNRIEWALPGAFAIDPILNEYDAYNLPVRQIEDVDYIFSSHCLEHLPHWVGALDYWHTRLKPGGVMFLYLPDFSQIYWRPWHNRKHVHCFTPEIVGAYFKDQPGMWKNVFVSSVDLNNAFTVIAEKK